MAQYNCVLSQRTQYLHAKSLVEEIRTELLKCIVILNVKLIFKNILLS